MTNTTKKTAGEQELEKLSEQFEKFRKTRSHKTAAIPKDLLNAALELSNHLDEPMVRKRLGITKQQFDRINQSNSTPQQKTAENSDKFVEIDSAGTAAHSNCSSSNKDMKMDIHFPNGTIVSISHLSQSPLELLQRILGDSIC